MSLREKILGAEPEKPHSLEVPEWGGTFFVREMTGKERDWFEASVMQGGHANLQNIRAKLACLCLCDETGKRLFADNETELLSSKGAKALDRVFTAAQRVNGMTKGDVEELAKNSLSGPSAASGSDSA